MTIEKQKQLVKLLGEYQEDLLKFDALNKENYENTLTGTSVKSKYEYARKIKASLEKNIETSILPIY